MAVSSLSAGSKNQSAVSAGMITGAFGRGTRQTFSKSGVFKAPEKGLYRIRLWGGGSRGGVYTSGSTNFYFTGNGGGFALKTIHLEKDEEVPVSVGVGGVVGGTSSFGAYFSATGGPEKNSTFGSGGNGVNGDINRQGKTGRYTTDLGSRSTLNVGKAGNLIDEISFFYDEFGNPVDVESFDVSKHDIDFIGFLGCVGAGDYSSSFDGLVIVEY